VKLKTKAGKLVRQLLDLQRRLLAETLSAVGLLLITIGIFMFSTPLGVISAGVSLLVVAKACEDD